MTVPTEREWIGRSFFVKDNELYMRMPAPHTQVLPYFPQYDLDEMDEKAIVDYGKNDNCVGHQQRALLTYWSVRAFIESEGGVSLDLGSAGVHHPAALALDLYGNGETPAYGGSMSGVHFKGDAGNLFMFEDNSFSAVISNHLVEHLRCSQVPLGMDQQERRRIGCQGMEVIKVIRDHWIRVVRPGGYIVAIVPDDQYARDVGSSVLDYDQTHQHAWGATEFYDNIIEYLLDYVEVIEFDSLRNNFSFDFILRKK